ncbi:MAG: GNAT family N-acetyltransferase [Candidatus Dormibacter sp.]
MRHELDRFSCGEPELDSWLTQHARDASVRNTGRTFVWARGDRVVAYYTLAAHAVAPADAPRSIGRGSRHPIPAILLARLALDTSLHGSGRGAALLGDALGRALAAGEQVAARLVVVDALHDNAVRFYAHFGFQRTPVARRLVLKVSTISDALPR